jgi:hypothetical protein
MPPKEKKGAGALKEIDPSQYVRKPVSLTPFVSSEVEPLGKKLTGVVTNIESLFPEWGLDGEVWSEPFENEDTSVNYPSHVASSITQYKGIKSILGLDISNEPVDPKAKPAASKKPAKGSPVAEDITEELEKDEEGRSMPRMFLDNSNNTSTTQFDEYLIPRLFAREWSTEQNERRNIQVKLKDDYENPKFVNMDDEVELTEEDKTKQTDKLKEIYDNLISERDVDKEAPNGLEKDPYICSSFRMVSRFAPAILSNSDKSDTSMQYLWKSVYPQLPTGRPCYNASGKYCVRLFLAGKWRKITVNDSIPLDADGLPVISCSSDSLEMWPLILSKAIYTVYNACGYNDILSNLSEEGLLSHSPTRVASFSVFALHLLTSWQPGSPWSLSETVNFDLVRANKLMDDILFSGAMSIDAENIPSETPKEDDDKPGDGIDLDGNLIYRTKANFKAEYRTRMAERDAVLQLINLREEKIEKIVQALRKPYSEASVLCFLDNEGIMRVVPILALSPEDKDNIGLTKVLITWEIVKTSAQVSEDYKIHAAATAVDRNLLSDSDKQIVKMSPYLAGLDRDLEALGYASTVANSEWLTINELVERNAVVFNFNTKLRTPNSAALGWHWQPCNEIVGGKDSKGGKGKDKSDLQVDVLCEDRGALPAVLLKINSSSFFTKEEVPESTPEEKEIKEAIEAQSEALGSSEQDLTKYTPNSSHLSVALLICADLTADEATGDVLTKRELSDGVVVVLQELRDDGKEPIVLRFELGKDSFLPMSRTTFHIDANRLNPTTPSVFWVRLFTKASVYLTINSGAEVSVGPAETIWGDLGKKLFVKEGTTLGVRPFSEQLLFRVPLNLEIIDDNENDSDSIIVFLQISEREIASTVSLLIQADYNAENGEESFVLPRLNGNVITMCSSLKKVKTLIARCFPGNNGNSAIPEFNWKLICLSNKAIKEPKLYNEQILSQRFSGFFYPNNKLIVFQDVISVDKDSFPLALRLTLENLECDENNSEDKPKYDVSEDTVFIVKTYRKSDRKLIGQFVAQGMIQLYDIQIDNYLEDSEEAPGGVPQLDAKGKPIVKSDPKGGKTAADGTQILFEVSVDESQMNVPNEWRARFPFTFDNSIASACSSAQLNEGIAQPAPVGTAPYPVGITSLKPYFRWQIDILAGSVIEMSHDIFNLQRQVELKNKWETTTDGRAKRAIAAGSYYKEKIAEQIKKSNNESTEVNQDMVKFLASALIKDASILQPREELIRVSKTVSY